MKDFILIFRIFLNVLQFILEVNTPIGAGSAVLFIFVTYVAVQAPPATAPSAAAAPDGKTPPASVPKVKSAPDPPSIPSAAAAATTTPTTSTRSTIGSSSTATENNHNFDISPGSIIGGIVGGLIIASLIALIVLVIFLVRRNIDGSKKAITTPPTNMPYMPYNQAIATHRHTNTPYNMPYNATPGHTNIPYNMPYNGENNYKVSNPGITIDELSQGSYGTNSSPIPQERLISNPGQEHIPNHNHYNQQGTTQKFENPSLNSHAGQSTSFRNYRSN